VRTVEIGRNRRCPGVSSTDWSSETVQLSGHMFFHFGELFDILGREAEEVLPGLLGPALADLATG